MSEEADTVAANEALNKAEVPDNGRYSMIDGEIYYTPPAKAESPTPPNN